MSDDTTWLNRASQRLASASLGVKLQHVGRVQSVSDGVAMVSGLDAARLDERLVFEGGQSGFVHTLDREQLGCVLLDAGGESGGGVVAGQSVYCTGEVVRVPVGPGLLGRVVDRSMARW